MAAVTNTTPLNYLILVGAVDVLPQLYERVLVPQAVVDELLHPRAPEAVREWIAARPPWIEVRSVPPSPDPQLAALEPGERDAILLAEQVSAALLLIDERDGREAARHRGLKITGTLGVLDRAAERGLIDFPVVIERLKGTTFRMSAVLLRQFLERAALRGQPDTRKGGTGD